MACIRTRCEESDSEGTPPQTPIKYLRRSSVAGKDNSPEQYSRSSAAVNVVNDLQYHRRRKSPISVASNYYQRNKEQRTASKSQSQHYSRRLAFQNYSSSDDEAPINENISIRHILNQRQPNDGTFRTCASETNNGDMPSYNIDEALTNSETCDSAETNSGSDVNESLSDISSEMGSESESLQDQPESQNDYESTDSEMHEEEVNEFEIPVYDGSRISMRGI